MKATADEMRPGKSECWCCGNVDAPENLVHLGNHPEVTVCTRCAHSISKWAWEIEDRSKTGHAVRMRDKFRVLRRAVIQRGWHQSRLFGGPIRSIGRHLP